MVAPSIERAAWGAALRLPGLSRSAPRRPTAQLLKQQERQPADPAGANQSHRVHTDIINPCPDYPVSLQGCTPYVLCPCTAC